MHLLPIGDWHLTARDKAACDNHCGNENSDSHFEFVFPEKEILFSVPLISR
jgi:hypothetical protein